LRDIVGSGNDLFLHYMQLIAWEFFPQYMRVFLECPFSYTFRSYESSSVSNFGIASYTRHTVHPFFQV
jgi:hypothetical protein